MACSSPRMPAAVSFGPSSTVTSTTAGTVLPPSFHPLNTRTPRDRGAPTSTGLVSEMALGLNSLQRNVVGHTVCRPLPGGHLAARGGHSTSGPTCNSAIPSLSRDPPPDLTRASIASLNSAMLQQPIPGWNGLGYFPMVPMEALNATQLAGLGAWSAKQPMINRDYLELAMLVCNTFRGKLFPCPHCRYVTDRRNNLKRHIATMHETCEKVLECCGVVFQTKASLREHIMIFHHNGYSCPYCGRRFCRKALLKRHLSVHSGRKDYSCPHCDYATSHKSNLERHKKIHDRSVKMPLAESKRDADVLFLDEDEVLSSTTSHRDPSPAPPDSTVTCSAIDLSSASEKMMAVNDVMSESDDSLSDEDVDVECG